MTSYRICEAPVQDECGSWYCPVHPEDNDYDCQRCKRERELAEDRAVEAKWERQQERDVWGGQ